MMNIFKYIRNNLGQIQKPKKKKEVKFEYINNWHYLFTHIQGTYVAGFVPTDASDEDEARERAIFLHSWNPKTNLMVYTVKYAMTIFKEFGVCVNVQKLYFTIKNLTMLLMKTQRPVSICGRILYVESDDGTKYVISLSSMKAIVNVQEKRGSND